MNERPSDTLLASLFEKQLELDDTLKSTLERFHDDYVHRGEEKTYQKLEKMVRANIEEASKRKNAEQMAKRNSTALVPTLYDTGVCNNWLFKGNCSKRESCPWASSHTAENKGAKKKEKKGSTKTRTRIKDEKGAAAGGMEINIRKKGGQEGQAGAGHRLLQIVHENVDPKTVVWQLDRKTVKDAPEQAHGRVTHRVEAKRKFAVIILLENAMIQHVNASIHPYAMISRKDPASEAKNADSIIRDIQCISSAHPVVLQILRVPQPVAPISQAIPTSLQSLEEKRKWQKG